MGNCLVLISSSYPFLTQENFLETELPFHTEHYEKIIILAIDVDPGAEKMRGIPRNTDAYNISARPQKLARLGDVARGAVRLPLKPDYLADEKKYIGNDIRKRVFLEYFVERSRRQYGECSRILDKYDFSKYDGVMIYSYWFFASAVIGSMLRDDIAKKCPRVKFISRAHGYDVYERANSLGYLPMREYLLRSVDAVFPCSVDGEKHISERFPQYKDKINHSYLGSFDNGLSSPSEDVFHIVSCSRFKRVKRVDRIVDSLAALRGRTDKKLVWTHIGSGSEEAQIKKLAEEKLGFMRVEFTGEISNSQVYDYYKTHSVDLFVNTSSSEGVPVSVMEAISFGIPVIATNVGGVGEIIREGTDGWLMDADFKDEELAGRILEVIGYDCGRIRELRKNVRAFWEQHFDAERNYSEFADKLVGMLEE